MYNRNEKAGKMRHRVRILQYLIGRDDYGGETRRWVASDPIWAHVEQRIVGSDEDEVSQRLVSQTATRVTIRHRSTIDASMKVLWGNRVISIDNVIPDAKEEYLLLSATNDEPTNLQSWASENGLAWVDQNGNWWDWSGGYDEDSEVDEDETWTDDAGLVWTKQ